MSKNSSKRPRTDGSPAVEMHLGQMLWFGKLISDIFNIQGELDSPGKLHSSKWVEIFERLFRLVLNI